MTPRQQFARSVRKVMLEHIVRRSVSEPPQDGTLTIVDNGSVHRWGSRRATARFKGNEWVGKNGKALTFAPTIWIEVRR